MTARPLHAVLRAIADAAPPATDADLLRRFVASRDDEAFAALVKRHGRLVWAVCRHLTDSDAAADDAFQATFLVLVRNAAGVKDSAKLSAWLHGVAYKVCGKSRLAARRRTTRERASAVRERNGHTVPDSAWDRALAAVHEEVAGLPEALRVPFVLCCLEGVGQTEAAERLGWKLGTLSGRLTRAKHAVMERLSARGLTLGVLASVGLAAVPAEVSAKAVGLGLVGSTIPGSVLQLSSGVIGMSVNKVKLLAAGVLATCGLAVSGGAGWVATAGAQSSQPARTVSPADKVKQLEAELQKAKAEAAEAEVAVKAEAAKAKAAEALARYEDAKGKKAEALAVTKRWEYEFQQAEAMTAKEFTRMLQSREEQGWEFVGTTPMKEPTMTAWVFRKPRGGIASTSTVPGVYSPAFPASPAPPAPPVVKSVEGVKLTPPVPPAPPAPPVDLLKPSSTLSPLAQQPDDLQAIEAEIKRLQEKLEAMKKGQSRVK